MKRKLSRREFLEAGAKATATVIAITACGDLFALGQSPQQKIASVVTGNSSLIIELEELEKQKAVNFTYKDKKAILLYNDGQVRAFENICTHKGGPAKLTGEKLVCQWHGAHFDPLTGEATKGPAPEGTRLKAVELKIAEGKIYTES